MDNLLSILFGLGLKALRSSSFLPLGLAQVCQLRHHYTTSHSLEFGAFALAVTLMENEQMYDQNLESFQFSTFYTGLTTASSSW